ncbi:MAG: c-type cytochrome [Marivivens sp.]|nr:c-type cytochrome [Marivivens sp.]
MKKLLIVGAAIAALSVAAYLAIPETPAPSAAGSALPPEGAPLVSIVVPDQLSAQAQLGKTAFDAVCATCHGSNATGKMGFGPPLIHPIYEPNHHGDMAFQMAAQNGVQAHHWPFGNMPPQAGVTSGDVNAIVAYVREIQRANGIN